MEIITTNPGWFTGQLARLYQQFSIKPLPRFASGVVSELMELCHHCGVALADADKDGRRFPACKRNPNQVVVGYSGGKDSVAALVMLADQGLEPIAFHVRGLNRSHPNEYAFAEQAAKELGVAFVSPTVRLRGKSNIPDNPVKDQLILAMMVDWGMEQGVHQFTLGTPTSHTLAHAAFDFNWTDTVEMVGAFGRFAKARWPSYTWRQTFNDSTQGYRVLCERGKLPLCVSCVLSHRFQEQRRKGNQEKYGVELYAGRCGSCYKCCLEYAHEVGLGYRKANPAFLAHCLHTLAANLKRYANVKLPGKPTPRIALAYWCNTKHINPDELLELAGLV